MLRFLNVSGLQSHVGLSEKLSERSVSKFILQKCVFLFPLANFVRMRPFSDPPRLLWDAGLSFAVRCVANFLAKLWAGDL